VCAADAREPGSDDRDPRLSPGPRQASRERVRRAPGDDSPRECTCSDHHLSASASVAGLGCAENVRHRRAGSLGLLMEREQAL
jgi:hypothetical protein